METITLGIAHMHIHRWSTATEEIEWDTPYIGRRWVVRHCPCGSVDRYGGGGYSRTSPEAVELLERVAKALGRPSPVYRVVNGQHVTPPYGSGWYCELPAVLAQIIDQQGEPAAEQLLRQAFAAGDSGVVTRPALGY